MLYRIEIKQQAEQELDALPAGLRHQTLEKTLALEQDPRPKGLRKLAKREAYCLRVGPNRILLEINDAKCTITVFAIGHRKDVYW